MSNAVVYSLHLMSEPKDSLAFWQLKHSIETLRKHNSDIGVLVYLSPSTNKIDSFGLDLEIVYWDAIHDQRFVMKDLALMLEHRWISMFDALEKFDRVLFVDCDTVFQSDPEYMFDKYKPGNVYAKKQWLYNDFLDFFKIDHEVMNDGTVLLDKSALKHKDAILKSRNDFIFQKQTELNNDIEDYRMGWVHWAGTQYGVSNYLYELGIFKDFDHMDVSLYPHWENMQENMRDKVAIVHYFNYNSVRFMPKNYLDELGFIPDQPEIKWRV